jgi:hypothetical protein
VGNKSELLEKDSNYLFYLGFILPLSIYLYSVPALRNNQESSSMTITAFLLQTKLALVQGNVEEASQLLINAKKIALKKKLVTILAQIKAEQETVQAELDKWNELI